MEDRMCNKCSGIFSLDKFKAEKGNKICKSCEGCRRMIRENNKKHIEKKQNEIREFNKK